MRLSVAKETPNARLFFACAMLVCSMAAWCRADCQHHPIRAMLAVKIIRVADGALTIIVKTCARKPIKLAATRKIIVKG